MGRDGFVTVFRQEPGPPLLALFFVGEVEGCWLDVEDCLLVDIVDDRRTGLLVEPNSVESLRVAMAEIDHDDDLAATLGAAAQLESQRYRADRVVPDIVAVYRSAINGQTNG